jgi:Domain of unknown function (DUF397)
VTVRPEWRKSSYSSDSANCVEAAALADTVLLRDSKDPTGPVLTFGADAWAAFLAAVQDGVMGEGVD